MGVFRDNIGAIVEVDDAFAQSQGYTPVGIEEEAATNRAAGTQEVIDDRGALGAVNAGATRFLSGATLGASDVGLSVLLGDDAQRRLREDIAAHPIASTIGEVGGAVTGSLAGGGAYSPVGALSNAAGRVAESGLARGGIAGTAKALGAMGAEGAIQNAGAYIGQTALADKEVTVEGMSGALGTGFAFGAAGGGAALGISKGTMAARKIYARYAEGAQGASDAATAFERQAQVALDQSESTMNIAQAKVDAIKQAKMEADIARKRAGQRIAEEKGLAKNPAPREKPITEFGTEKFGPDVAQRGGAVEPFGPDIAGRGGLEKYGPDEPYGPFGTNQKTKVAPRPEGVAPVPEGTVKIERPKALDAAPAKPQSILEEARASRQPDPSDPIAGWLDEEMAVRASKQGDSLEGKLASMAEQAKAGKQLDEMSEALGDDLAKQFDDLERDLAEFQDARKDFLDKVVGQSVDQFKPGNNVPNEFTSRATLEAPDFASRQARQVELDDLHDAAFDRWKRAVDPDEAAAAAREVESLESQMDGLESLDDAPRSELISKIEGKADEILGVRRTPSSMEKTGVGKRPKSLDADVAEHAPVIDRFEKAHAKLAETLGELAPPAAAEHAKAYNIAADDATRKMTDRQVRAADDAEMHGPYEEVGPKEASPKERVQYAKDRKAEADAKYNQLVIDEIPAAAEARAAKKAHVEGKKAFKQEFGPKGKSAASSSNGAVAAAAGASEWLDIPGMPKLSDIPVVGPLLGAYVKFKTAKFAMGKLAGRIPASADARIAALAAKTRDRVAKSVDRSLGLLGKGADKAMKHIPKLTAIVGERIWDDGLPDAPAGAPIGEMVAIRVRELSNYVTTPNAIERDVRKQLKDVADPDVIEATEKHRRAAMEYLLAQAPKVPPAGLLNKTKFAVSPSAAMKFARTWQAVNDPASVFEQITYQRNMLTLEAAEALRAVYPKLFTEAQVRLVERSKDLKTQLPYAQRVQMSLLYNAPLDSSLDPDNMKIIQSTFVKPPPQPAMGGAGSPMPSIAGQTNMTALFQTTADRRSSR